MYVDGVEGILFAPGDDAKALAGMERFVLSRAVICRLDFVNLLVSSTSIAFVAHCIFAALTSVLYVHSIYADPDLMRKMCHAARARFESTFDLNIMVEAYQQLVLKVAPPVILLVSRKM